VKASGRQITRATEIYQSLRAAVLNGSIGAGLKLRTNRLCREFDVSLGAVREALSQLSAEGLVLSEAHRGYTVSSISPEDLADLTRVRIEIENLCLTWAIQAGTVEWESNIIAAAYRLMNTARMEDGVNSSDRWTVAHDNYHLALVSACGSPRLLQIRQQLYERSERYRRLELTLPRRRNFNEEHDQLAKAAIARDVPLATRLMREHISRTTENVMKALAESMKSPAAREERLSRRVGSGTAGARARLAPATPGLRKAAR
jgi:GntR family transcriptional regulator, carbon starvation induced regulator